MKADLYRLATAVSMLALLAQSVGAARKWT